MILFEESRRGVSLVDSFFTFFSTPFRSHLQYSQYHQPLRSLSYISSMYPTSTAPSLPPLSLHLGNLPGFEFSSDRETPISNPPSSVFSGHSAATSALSSTSISPLNLLSATPINQSIPVCKRTGPNHVLQRASTLPLTNLPLIPRIAPPTHCQLPEGFQKCSFVDSLVGQQSYCCITYV